MYSHALNLNRSHGNNRRMMDDFNYLGEKEQNLHENFYKDQLRKSIRWRLYLLKDLNS